MAKNITPRKEDYSKWYLDVIAAGQLADYAPVKGCMVIRPTGYAIWEAMQSCLDRMFKETGHEKSRIEELTEFDGQLDLFDTFEPENMESEEILEDSDESISLLG